MQDPLANLDQSKSPTHVLSALGLLRKRKWLILGLTVAAAVAAGFIVSKQPPVYEATASMVIELSVPQYLGAGFRDVVEVEPSWWHSRETLETEFRTLRSESHALSVAKALCERKLGGGPALKVVLPDVKCEDPADLARAAPILRGMLRVSPVKDSRIVELTIQSSNPDFAALAANTSAQVYAERNLERRLSHSAGAATWLGDEYTHLLNELRKAEQALLKFKEENKIVAAAVEDDQNEHSGRRKKVAEELNSVEVKLIALRAEREQFESFGKNDPLQELNPALAKNQVAQKLKELFIDEYGKLIALQGKYLEKHPAVVAQEERLKLIRNDLTREVEIARNNFEAEYSALSKQANDLRAAFGQATQEAIKIEGKTAEYRRLQRELDRLIKLSEHVGGRERETSLASNLKTNNVRLLDRATVPVRPVAPSIPKSVGLAVGVALLLSIGLALLLDALDNTVKTQEDIEQYARLPFLGLIPTIEKNEANGVKGSERKKELLSPDFRDLYVFTHPTSQVAECCRAIRTNLLFMSPDRPAKTLLITSAGPQEGKTTVAVNLGITMALSGLKVVLVDTDMRRPRLHRALSIPSSVEGVSGAIVGQANVGSLARATPVPNLWVLPCGACPPNPAELLHTERFRNIVADLRRDFDLVIFDSPPLGAVTDASILARITDATMMVAKAGRTSKYALTRARRQLGTNVNVLGCVLNDISLSRQREYGYYSYYYSRYGYYGQDERPAASGQA
jgi:polysaccharide biosynthesis transport protein